MPDALVVNESSNTMSRLRELVQNLEYLQRKQQGDAIDDVNIRFVTPLSIVPLAALINQNHLRYDAERLNTSYLQTIHFPEGIEEERLSGTKTYFPIIRLELAGLNRSVIGKKLNMLSAAFLNLLKRNIIGDPEFLERVTVNTFGFLLQELIDNIAEHSGAQNAYIFAQYWKATDSCEVCLLDDGKGLFGSLREAGRDVTDSQDAMKKILNEGLSAKDEFGETHRGTGLRNTRAVISSREINGQFLLLSGDAAYLHSSAQGENLVQLSNACWNGTIVMLQLQKPVSPFNLYDYVR